MNCLNPKLIFPVDDDFDEGVLVPCGKCLACLCNKRADWSFRLRQEHKHSCGSLFVTLTYGDRKVPKDGLCKRDVQLFLKRLRKRVSSRLRYYCVGEYGSKFGRPHYHMLLFNIDPADEIKVRKSWTLGHVHIGQVTEASVSYCLKYMVQPELCVYGKTKPFSLMSRAYGIGGHYLTDEMVAWHREDMRLYAIEYGKKVRLPRYYQDRIFYDKEKLSKAKEKLYFEQLKSRIALGERYSESVLKEFSDAYYARVKTKVAFTQKF